MNTPSCLYVTLLQVHVHLKRHLMKDLPEGDDAVAQWCRDTFTAKVIDQVFIWHLFFLHSRIYQMHLSVK